MIFDRNENKEVIALLGAGSMGTAISRRFAAGRIVLLGDISEKNLERVAAELRYSGYTVETCIVNAMNKDSVETFAQKAASLGPVKYFIDTDTVFYKLFQTRTGDKCLYSLYLLEKIVLSVSVKL